MARARKTPAKPAEKQAEAPAENDGDGVDAAAAAEPEAEAPAVEPESPKESKRDRTAAKPKSDSYSVFSSEGKRLLGGVDRDTARRAFDETKRQDGRAPLLVRDGDG